MSAPTPAAFKVKYRPLYTAWRVDPVHTRRWPNHLRVVSTADATCSSNWAILWRNRGCTNVWQSSKSCVTVRWTTQWNEWELVTQMQPLHVQQRIVVVGAVTFVFVNGNRRWRCRAANVTTLYAAVTVRKLPFVSNVRAQTIYGRHSTDSSELRSDTPFETLTIWLFIIHLYDWHSYVHVIVFLLRKLLTHCKLCRRWKCGCRRWNQRDISYHRKVIITSGLGPPYWFLGVGRFLATLAAVSVALLLSHARLQKRISLSVIELCNVECSGG